MTLVLLNFIANRKIQNMKQFEHKVKQALREMTLWQFSLDVCFATPDDVKSNVSNFSCKAFVSNLK